jgi:hypothetical protein
MQVTVQDGVLCCGGVPIPDEDPALKNRERKTMTIIGIDRQDRKIVLCAEKPLTGRTILFTGSKVYCEREKEYIDYAFLHRFEAKIGLDIVLAESRGGVPIYLWINPQETFIKDYRIGHILIFIEI